MKKLFVSLCLVVVMTTVYFCPPLAQNAFSGDIEFENLTATVGRGFGDNWNRYAWSMCDFQGSIYVGTWNVQLDYIALVKAILSGQIPENPLEGIGIIKSEGGEIWRHDGGQNWTRVYKASPEDTGFRIMLEYKGALYVGSANSTTGASLLRSRDGLNWERLTGGPLGNFDNNSIRTLLIYKGQLLVGTENNNTGGELWAFNGSSWKFLKSFAPDASVAEMCEFDSKLYVGTWNFNDVFRLFESTDGVNFTNVTPVFPGSESLNNLGVMKLIEYKGYFYLGTVNYLDGFTLIRTKNPGDTQGWEVITKNGFGDKDNSYTWCMIKYKGLLYLGTFNSGIYGGLYYPLFIPLDGRAQLWNSADGKNWRKVVNDGFDKFNYGFRTLVASDGRLIIGTASDFLIPDPATYDFDEIKNMIFDLLGDQGDYDSELIMKIWLQLKSYIQMNPNWIGTEIWATTR